MAVTTTTDPQDQRYPFEVPRGAVPPAEVEMTLEQARIPTARYTSPEFHRREIEKMWLSVWQMACRQDDLPAAGDYVRYDVADQSFLIVRQGDGGLKAFHNVCRHRGNLLRRDECGSAGEFRCPYHLWAWNTDGSLKDIPDRHLFIGIGDEEYGLPEVAVDTWGGFVFVHPDAATAEPLLEFLSPVPEHLDSYHFEEMIPSGINVSMPVSANWKVVVEAFLEVYHTMGIHPQLLPMLDDIHTYYETFGKHSRMIVPFAVASPRLGDVDELEILEAYLASFGQSVRREKGTSRVEGASGLLALFVDEAGELRLPDPSKTTRRTFVELFRGYGESQGFDYSELHDDQMVDDWHYTIFPNLVFNIHAGNFLFFRILPDWQDPDTSWFHVATYRWVPEDQRAAQRTAHRVIGEREESLGLVLDQDMENLPGVQRGLHSKGIDAITVSRQEIRITHLHEVLDTYLDA